MKKLKRINLEGNLMHPFNPATELILQSGFSLFSKVSMMMMCGSLELRLQDSLG